jgi:hypothetical protein
MAFLSALVPLIPMAAAAIEKLINGDADDNKSSKRTDY